MKLSAILILTFFLSGFAYAQSADSTAAGPQRGNGKQQRMDRFIDEDGDGICDRRAQGLGFGRQKKMHGMKQQDNHMRQNKGKAQQGGNKK
jgi:hypothetical protein